MKIEHIFLSVREIANGYADKQEDGVVAFGGRLNVRPPYQREFVYKDAQRNAVIETIRKGFPLNVIYWAKNDNGTFEILDGQQRTISFCQYVNGEFSLNDRYFHNLTEEEKDAILNYQVDIYVCEGSDRERLDWFETINIAGEKLTRQELLNINYTGAWLSDAKRKFSKTGCVAYNLASKFVKGTPIGQEYLETALYCISKGNIADYMSKHQHDENANELWQYFSGVIEWIKKTFGERNYRREMLGLNWGYLYWKYGRFYYDTDNLEAEIKSLMEDDEVTEKKGIFEYVLSGNDENIARKLSKRAFSNSDKRTVYERQNGVCPHCGKQYDIKDMVGDHIVPWWRGGKTTIDNLQMLCVKCNSGKGGKM